MTETQCPSCDRNDFKNWSGVSRHHSIEHGESLIAEKRTCKYWDCGEEITNYPGSGQTTRKYCSKNHMRKSFEGEWQSSDDNISKEFGENHPRWVEREQRVCPIDGNQFSVRKTSNRKACSEECGRILAVKNTDWDSVSKKHKGKEIPKSLREQQRDRMLEKNPMDNPKLREKVSKKLKEYYSKNEHHRKGKSLTESHKRALSEAWSERIISGNFVSEYDDDLGHVVRSEWERELGNILKKNNIDYSYESIRIKVDGRYYIPDFITDNSVIEVKGWVTEKAVENAEAALDSLDKTYIVVGSDIPSDIHIPWSHKEEILDVL